MNAERRKLPNRRQHQVIAFELDNITFIAGVGYFPDRTLAEVFFHQAGKPGSSSERFAADSAVLISLALQFGASVSAIRHSLPKLRDGSAAGPIGRLLDLIEADNAS